jgi:hypothetical protein
VHRKLSLEPPFRGWVIVKWGNDSTVWRVVCAAFYTALFTTAFAIAGLASDSWFTKGSMYSMGAKPSMNIGLLKSTWHYTCPSAFVSRFGPFSDALVPPVPILRDDLLLDKTEPTSNIVSASHNAAALFAVTVVFGILTTITCLLCGISINSFRVRALSIVSSTLFCPYSLHRTFAKSRFL